MLTASGTTNHTCGDPDGGSVLNASDRNQSPSLDGVAFPDSNVLIGLSAGTYNQVEG